MDALTAAGATAVGCLVGMATGLVPGLHVNTLCAVGLSLAPGMGPTLAVGLCAMAVAHGFASHLPSTYLGAPGEDTLLSAMPAHRMLLAGKGLDAVQVSLDGALAGLVLAVALLLPYKWVLGEPGGLLDALDGLMAWVLATVLVFLLARETRRGLRSFLWAVVVLALAAILGLVAGRIEVAALVPVPASALLPLLSGLFGAPALLETLRSHPEVPPQEPARPPPTAVRRRCRRGIVSGVLAAAMTSVLPGMTSAIAATAARAGASDRAEHDPRPVLATLGAIGLAQVVLAFGVLWLSLRARSGLAAAVQQVWAAEAWTLGAPPVALRWLLVAALGSGVVAHLGVAAMAGPVALWMGRASPRWLSASALAIVVALVALLSGLPGLAIFVTATAVGLVPAATGTSRIHLTGCLLVPVLFYRLGWA
ncbi:MAG TPA: tripartite tricarboxylate transporter permease [Candidatus Thermoplasmatota archaeon]|nr:tripartite tricarboxylate transporter permease [Candidatus Thermoplasmatota archaeon]